MCGIVGIIAKDGKLPIDSDDIFTEMLQCNTLRGADSTGIFGVRHNGKVDIMKGDVDGYGFTSTSNYEQFYRRINSSYQVVIGHNRKATRGKITPENAHPFYEKNIVLVHNGVVHNADELNSTVEVDSHAIVHALLDHDMSTALSKINGAFALVWYDQKEKLLHLARNQERPLYLIEYERFWLISSEAGLAFWIAGRHSEKSKAHTLVSPSKIISFDLSGAKISAPYETDFEEFKTWTPQRPTPSTFPAPQWKPPLGRADGAGTSQSPIILAPTGTSISSDTQAKVLALGIKRDDIIRFRPDDTKLENGVEVILGAYIRADRVVDENWIVRAIMGHYRPEDFEKWAMWEGRVLFIREVGKVYPIITVKDIRPLPLIVDAFNNEHVLEELKLVLDKQLCGKCESAIFIEDVKDSLVKKKADGTYRCVCTPCLITSLEEGKQNAGKTQLHLVH